jgi:hypothetical protein
VPVLAADLARASHTPLNVIAGWSLSELYFWHATFVEMG